MSDSKQNILRHGLSIGIQRVDSDFFLIFTAVGKLTHEDYLTITPLIDSALEGVKEPHIKAMVDISELTGWELRAAWDDFKIALKHGSEFKKIAIYGNQNWLEYSVKVSSWFMQGEIKQFDSYDEGLEWLRN